MNPARTDFSDEVEERVRAHGANRRYMQTKNKEREQQNAPPQSRHSNEGPDAKTHQDLDQQIHDNTGFCFSVVRRHSPERFQMDSAAVPMKPSRSRCRIIS